MAVIGSCGPERPVSIGPSVDDESMEAMHNLAPTTTRAVTTQVIVQERGVQTNESLSDKLAGEASDATLPAKQTISRVDALTAVSGTIDLGSTVYDSVSVSQLWNKILGAKPADTGLASRRNLQREDAERRAATAISEDFAIPDTAVSAMRVTLSPIEVRVL